MTSQDVVPRPTATTGTRQAVLELVRGSREPVAVATVAEQLQIHPNTARFHLRTLTEHGRVEQVRITSTGRGRPPLRYRTVRAMDAQGPRRYRLLANILLTAFARTPALRQHAVRAGRDWGRQLPPPAARGRGRARSVRQLVTMLDELGFDPVVQGSGPVRRIGLRHCPFLEVATQDPPGLVCQIHLGVLQGALESWESPVTVDRLESFAAPDLCVAHVVPSSAPSRAPRATPSRPR